MCLNVLTFNFTFTSTYGLMCLINTLNTIIKVLNMNISQIIPSSAKAAHAELLESLGTENNPSQWMIFMESVDKHIPEMTSKGRPSNKAIDVSLIGQLGFKSWKDMVEAPIENNGLGWSSGGWNSWRRAWGVVKDYPFLRQENIKAGWVNALINELKKEGIQFPINKQEFDELKEKREKAAAENKNTKLKAAEETIISLQKEAEKYKNHITELKSKFVISTAERDQLKSDYHASLDKIGQQGEKIGLMKKDLDSKKSDLTKLKTHRIGKLQALKILFGRD